MNYNKTSDFEFLYKEYYKMVFQMCLGFMKGNTPQAEDLLQEVFINTWNALDKFKGKSSYKTWLYRITVNTCLEFIRKDHKHKTESIPDSQFEMPQDDENSQLDDNNQGLYKAIGKLDELDRLIIIMVLDGLEYKEISTVIGITEVNLRVKIHRIKIKLKKLMSHEEYI